MVGRSNAGVICRMYLEHGRGDLLVWKLEDTAFQLFQANDFGSHVTICKSQIHRASQWFRHTISSFMTLWIAGALRQPAEKTLRSPRPSTLPGNEMEFPFGATIPTAIAASTALVFLLRCDYH
jgi:hypothetical protein